MFVSTVYMIKGIWLNEPILALVGGAVAAIILLIWMILTEHAARVRAREYQAAITGKK